MWVLKVTRFAPRVSYLFFPFYLDCSLHLASLLLKQPGKVIDFPRSWRSRAPDYSVAFPIQSTEPLEGHICARWHETVQEEEVCHVAVAHDSEPSCLLGRVRGQITDLEKKLWAPLRVVVHSLSRSSWEAETHGTLMISNPAFSVYQVPASQGCGGRPCLTKKEKSCLFFVNQSKAFLEELFAIVQKGVT